MPRKQGLDKTPPSTVKLQKYLADRGYGSRRKLEIAIEQGRVVVNGETAQISCRVSNADEVLFDGKRVSNFVSSTPRVLVMNKSSGMEVSRNPDTEATSVFDELPKIRQGRWVSVGRLDVATSGLLMFTNNGNLANRLMHPSSGLDREYAVRVRARLDETQIELLTTGVLIDDVLQRFSDVQYFDGGATNHWYHVVLMEGRNREVRKLFASQGVTVSRLKRVRFGPMVLPSWLTQGRVVEMKPHEVQAICNLLEFPYEMSKRHIGSDKKKMSSLLIPYEGMEVDFPLM